MYRPPQAALGELASVATLSREARSANGSWIRIGTRRHFTTAESLRSQASLVVLLWVVYPLGAIVYLRYAGGRDALLLARAAFGVTVIYLVPALSTLVLWSNSRAHRMVAKLGLRRGPGFVAGLVTSPRLPDSPSRWIDGDDDTGFLRIDGARLVFAGDRFDARIARADVAEVRAGPRTPHGLGLVRSVVVELREPLAEIESFTLVCQDGLTLPTIAIAARAMRDALSGWSTTRPLPLPIQVEPRGGP